MNNGLIKIYYEKLATERMDRANQKEKASIAWEKNIKKLNDSILKDNELISRERDSLKKTNNDMVK